MNVVNNVDMSSLRAPWQMARTKTNTHNNTQTRRTPSRNRHLEKFLSFCKKNLNFVNDLPVERILKPLDMGHMFY